MKAQDLRIGNLVNLIKGNGIDGIEYKTHELTGFDIYKLEESDCFDILPIELTEEWLLKMGLTKNGREEFEFKRYRLYQPVSYVNFLFCEGNLVLREIKYVHTLQNLIHALTGEELTIK